MAQFFSIHPEHPQPRLVRQAAEIVRNGGLIAFPTDAAYALGGHTGDAQLLERIRRIRGVDEGHHFTLMCCDLSQIATYARASTWTWIDVFKLPTVALILGRIGLITPKIMLKAWRYSVVIIAIISALLTPTADPLNMLIFAAPMVAVYFLSVGIVWIFGKQRRTDEEVTALATTE